MNAERLIAEVLALGARFELAGESFNVQARRGVIDQDLHAELAAHKEEIRALLSLSDVEVAASCTAGKCPHCREPLQVYTHPLDEEVWIQCPSKPELFKQLRRGTNEWCADCGMKLSELAGRCVECVRRVMLAPDAPCPECGGLRFWRHRASCGKPAGSLWRCANCDEPAGKVAIYELTKQEAD